MAQQSSGGDGGKDGAEATPASSTWCMHIVLDSDVRWAVGWPFMSVLFVAEREGAASVHATAPSIADGLSSLC